MKESRQTDAKRLLGYMVVAFLATIGFIFILQTFVAQSTNTNLAMEKFGNGKGKACKQ